VNKYFVRPLLRKALHPFTADPSPFVRRVPRRLEYRCANANRPKPFFRYPVQGHKTPNPSLALSAYSPLSTLELRQIPIRSTSSRLTPSLRRSPPPPAITPPPRASHATAHPNPRCRVGRPPAHPFAHLANLFRPFFPTPWTKSLAPPLPPAPYPGIEEPHG